MSVRKLLLTLLLVGAATPVVAQQRISEGANLRIQVQEPNLASVTYEGTLVHSPSGFTLQATDPRADGGMIAVPLADVTRIELYRERDRVRSAKRGATIMGFIGGSLGVIAGPIIAAQIQGSEFSSIVAKSTAIGLGSGLILGGAGGAMFASDGWERYSVPVDWR